MPRVWLVGSVATLSAEEVLKAIKTSRLPDGRTYDPSRLALLEETLPLTTQANFNGAATVAELQGNTMSVSTSSATPAFLITSDTFYPGWGVSIDGQPARLLRTNYALRGVEVPAGEHLVQFEYKPKSFYYGLLLSLLSALVLLGTAGLIRRNDPRTYTKPDS